VGLVLAEFKEAHHKGDHHHTPANAYQPSEKAGSQTNQKTDYQEIHRISLV